MPTDPHTALAVAALLVGALAWWRPQSAIALLLTVLPFFLHHPITTQALALIGLVAVIQAAYILRARPSWTRTWRAISSQPLLLLSGLFAIAAILSLSSLPLAGIWSEHAAVAGKLAARSWPGELEAWMRLPESRREFSVTSAVLTLQGFLLALMIWREARASSAVALRFAAAITLGTVAFVAIGLLEAFGLVSLQALRGTTNVAFRAETLQSSAGNPGWFSQYLVYAMPYALVLLAGTPVVARRVVLLGAVTAFIAFALLVCFQRGGWISGAILVCYIAAAAFILVRSSGQDRASRQVWRGLGLAGLILVLVAGGLSLWLSRPRPDGDTQHLSRAPAVDCERRAAALLHRWQGDRGAPPGAGRRARVVCLPLRHVLSAPGRRLFSFGDARAGGRQRAQRVPPDVDRDWWRWPGAARGDLRGHRRDGCPRPPRTHRRPEPPGSAAGGLRLDARRRRVRAGAGVFYIHALRLLFFVGIGLVSGSAVDAIRWPAWTPRALGLALAAAFAGHLAYEYAWPGPARLLRSGEPTGLFGEERGPRDTRFRWSTDWATWPVPVGATSYSLQVRSVAPSPQEVEIQTCRGARLRVSLPDQAWRPLGGSLDGCAPGDHLQLRVSPAWRPPGDGRLLGVMTADVSFQ